MRLSNSLAVFAFLTLIGVPAQAQLKDIPSQAELDPILENADKKLTDFLATLNEFRVEASEMDRERFDEDVKSIRQLREIIRVTHSGNGKKQGMNMGRLLLVLTGLDDMALDAATWKSLAELQMCRAMVQRQDTTRYDQFGARTTTNTQMLREVGGQLFHPTVRMADAADQIVAAFSDAAARSKTASK